MTPPDTVSAHLKAIGPKRRFLLSGAVNALATNATLQLLLLLPSLPAGFCTLFSQLVNGSFGYVLYGKWVFGADTLRNSQYAIRYASLQATLWILDWALVLGGERSGFNRNIAALIAISPLAVISYGAQKKWVFRSK